MTCTLSTAHRRISRSVVVPPLCCNTIRRPLHATMLDVGLAFLLPALSESPRAPRTLSTHLVLLPCARCTWTTYGSNTALHRRGHSLLLPARERRHARLHPRRVNRADHGRPRGRHLPFLRSHRVDPQHTCPRQHRPYRCRRRTRAATCGHAERVSARHRAPPQRHGVVQLAPNGRRRTLRAPGTQHAPGPVAPRINTTQDRLN